MSITYLIKPKSRYYYFLLYTNLNVYGVHVNNTSLSELFAQLTRRLFMLQQYVKTQRTLRNSRLVVNHTFMSPCSLTLDRLHELHTRFECWYM
ncbi:hypothetical protein B7P43_G12460 [Cryptotermes secundus]|uniref:Uncharacterized protein n=1 Tax=Cryptotermes secundus TaxID=105785 RepID=A0A2J7PHD0_9NEOP|nr:hypothetical protein B7P43_G12460 [Cryptotermes secundus]